MKIIFAVNMLMMLQIMKIQYTNLLKKSIQWTIIRIVTLNSRGREEWIDLALSDKIDDVWSCDRVYMYKLYYL